MARCGTACISVDQEEPDLFSGSFVHSVDEKNRISVPAKLRQRLGDRFVLTKGPDGCLWVLPADQWRVLLAKSGKSVAIQRFFLASAIECTLGAKGRCLLPDDLRRYADIKPGDQVAIVGMINHIEIWSARRWDAVCAQLTSERIQRELPEFFVMDGPTG